MSEKKTAEIVENCNLSTEILIMLKDSNRRLWRVIFAVIIAWALTIAGFLFLIYSWEYEQSETTTEKTAEGINALVDSDGNIISTDFTAEDVLRILGAIENGESNIENDDD